MKSMGVDARQFYFYAFEVLYIIKRLLYFLAFFVYFLFFFFFAIIVLGPETRATGAKYQLRAPQPIAKKKYEECRYLDRPMGTLHTRATSTIVLSVFRPIEKLISPTVC